MGIKMPEVGPRLAILFEEIAADVLTFSKEHNASYPVHRSTVRKLLPVFDKISIEGITPQTMKVYLNTRDYLKKTTIRQAPAFFVSEA
jgi:hypothetical protein